METGDVVHHRIPVMKEKVTVMGLVMEVNMMVMPAAREILCVVATIVRSLDTIIMRRMTAVKDLPTQLECQAGVPGHLSHHVAATTMLALARRPELDTVQGQTVLGPRRHRIDHVVAKH